MGRFGYVGVFWWYLGVCWCLLGYFGIGLGTLFEYVGYFEFSKHWPSGPMLSICRFVHMSVCVCVCLSVCVCLFTFEVPFKRLFAPTSRSQNSKTIRDSESLGKSN